MRARTQTPSVYRAVDLDWDTPSETAIRIARLARILRVAFRQVYRTRTGYVLFWLNVSLWGLFAATRILDIH